MDKKTEALSTPSVASRTGKVNSIPAATTAAKAACNGHLLKVYIMYSCR